MAAGEEEPVTQKYKRELSLKDRSVRFAQKKMGTKPPASCSPVWWEGFHACAAAYEAGWKACAQLQTGPLSPEMVAQLRALVARFDAETRQHSADADVDNS